ncbi:uncharacterized protein LDX57_000952 [Aspergillus melleus]|uniref:uncharacterized protein n=1 Tax=Aspergillus melleus TaxID=138277 RepID=UPI001E8E91B5|nr:uncharacterized protein LDX57_000952 [Aspergillus melleus]KAH8423198.1 hypothetical protein LDX57_000952 [Aspergillus melleus]
MFLRRFLSHVLSGLIPLAIAATVYLYLYPIFHGCAFPLPTYDNAEIFPSGFLSAIRQHVSPQAEFDSSNPPAIFRLLVLADPQLEGDSSLPKAEDKLLARIKAHRSAVQSAIEATASPSPLPRDVVRAVLAALRSLVRDDVPRSLRAARKRLDLLGNDYYLAHIYRTLHWWTRPTHVTVLGDLIGSQWVTDEEFDRRGHRYWQRVFKGGERVSDALTGADTTGDGIAVDPAETLLNATDSPWTQRIINIAGNHDIGYSGDASEARIERFERVFGPANWDIRFRHPVQQAKEKESQTQDQSHDAPITPTLHVINLNTLTLDTPAFSTDVQARSYEYINDLITHRTYPVDDRATFTLLLTHLPLHKRKGICTDGPHFTFHESDDENGPDDVPRFWEGGLREQNHLSEHVSANGVLQGIFGMTGDEDAAGGGFGRNGLILTGHDHTGCDVVHYVDRTVEEKESSTDADETSVDNENNDNNEPPAWKWNARRYHRHNSSDARSDSPSIREVTLRSMMGEYGGNAGLLSLWFDADPAVGEWKYEITMCMAGVQHVWWAVHVLDLVVVIVVVVYLAMGAVGSRTQTQTLVQNQDQNQKPASVYEKKKQVQEKVQKNES